MSSGTEGTARDLARPSAADWRDALCGAAEESVSRGSFLSFAMPAPVADPLALLGFAPRQPMMVWEPPHGARMSGVGVAASVHARGAHATGEVRLWASALAARHEALAVGGVPLPALRFHGGFAFQTVGAVPERWREFGTGGFMVPRLHYRRAGGTAMLTVHVDGTRDRDFARDLVPYVARALDALEHGELPLDSIPPPGAAPEVAHLPREAWNALVLEARRAIRAGEFDKVVVARETHLSAVDGVDFALLLRRLRRAYPECFAFAFRPATSTFLGATPERLVRKQGSQVVTEALAGSIGVTTKNASECLRSSPKDLREHAFVVRHVIERLGELASEVACPPEPGVRVLANVLHLATPIHATLRGERHVLDVLEALHPTPAVGGAPVAEALAWIAAHEPTARGWYAGPIGWFDAQGDGEFAVALRSGLFTGADAWLYGGAGIVRDSEPDAEYDETALKLRALLGALGVLP